MKVGIVVQQAANMMDRNDRRVGRCGGGHIGRDFLNFRGKRLREQFRRTFSGELFVTCLNNDLSHNQFCQQQSLAHSVHQSKVVDVSYALISVSEIVDAGYHVIFWRRREKSCAQGVWHPNEVRQTKWSVPRWWRHLTWKMEVCFVEVVLEESAVADSQGNGLAEHALCEVKAEIRTLKKQVQELHEVSLPTLGDCVGAA